jgi:GNAT superfamily N-acetyltransferase
MTVDGRIAVRPADPLDAAEIREVAVAAWWATYRGRLADETIERFLSRAYTVERIAVRIDRHEVLVASADGGVGAFAEVVHRDDHVQLVAIYARPPSRGLGLGSALLMAILAGHPGEDLAADVLVGNELAEPFYAARGFAPGELLVDEIAGEPVRERRWWLRAAPAPER